jgi:transcriptional regulator with XRE-family HTH domain
MSNVPIELRELRAEMVMKELTVKEISDATGIAYTTVSSIINGRIVHPANLDKIRRIVAQAKIPGQMQPA